MVEPGTPYVHLDLVFGACFVSSCGCAQVFGALGTFLPETQVKLCVLLKINIPEGRKPQQ